MMNEFPYENLIYVGDNKRCPYGSKNRNEIINFTWNMVKYLLTKDIKLLVIACNTASSYALEIIRKNVKIPVIGVIFPGAKAAIKNTKSKNIAVIGTEGTINSGAYQDTLLKICPNLNIKSYSCPLFVPLIEKGVLSGPEINKAVKESLSPINKINVDTLILGCTHYPLIKDIIANVVGNSVNIVSSEEETVKEVFTKLKNNNLFNKTNSIGKYKVYTTGNITSFRILADIIFCRKLRMETKYIDIPITEKTCGNMSREK